MHNGQIGGYTKIRRRLEHALPDSLYCGRQGTTDSELIFLLALAEGLDEDPVGAMSRSLHRVQSEMIRAEIAEPLRFTAALSDGNRLIAFRYATDPHAPTLYHTGAGSGALTVVSEPLDTERSRWTSVPTQHVLSVYQDGRMVTEPLTIQA